MTRGNEFEISVEMTVNEEPMDIDLVECVEFSFNDTLRKIYPSPSVSFNSNRGCFLIHLTQEDTFSLNYSFLIQARVKFKNGFVFASSVLEKTLKECLSKEII